MVMIVLEYLPFVRRESAIFQFIYGKEPDASISKETDYLRDRYFDNTTRYPLYNDMRNFLDDPF